MLGSAHVDKNVCAATLSQSPFFCPCLEVQAGRLLMLAFRRVGVEVVCELLLCRLGQKCKCTPYMTICHTV